MKTERTIDQIGSLKITEKEVIYKKKKFLISDIKDISVKKSFFNKSIIISSSTDEIKISPYSQSTFEKINDIVGLVQGINPLSFYIKNEEKNILAYFSRFSPIFSPPHYYPLKISLCYQEFPAKEIFLCVMNDFSKSSKILQPDVLINLKGKEINLTGEKLSEGFFKERKYVEFYKFKITDETVEDILSSADETVEGILSSVEVTFLFSFKYRKGINVLSKIILNIGRNDFVNDFSRSPKIYYFLYTKTAYVMGKFRELYNTPDQELSNIKTSNIEIDFTKETEYNQKTMGNKNANTIVTSVVIVILLFFCIVSMPYMLSFRRRMDLASCRGNLRSLGFIIDNYATDNDGHYPQNLDVLVELGYLEKLPVCPKTNDPYVFEISGWEDETFTIWCPNPKRHIGDSGPCSHTLLLYYEPNSKVNQVDENSK